MTKRLSDIWFAIPSANASQCTATFARWRDRGYKTAVLVDGDAPEPDNADLIVRVADYRGYGASVNELCRRIDADWIVTGGDDTYPDPTHDPADIARECIMHFNGTFGVMQPTGDPWENYCIRKYAGSPWMGREFCRRINGGRGPYWEEYFQYYDDTELMNVCLMHKCYWQRPDLIHEHDHWTKKKIARPAYLQKAIDRGAEPMRIFERRRAVGFPGSEPID